MSTGVMMARLKRKLGAARAASRWIVFGVCLAGAAGGCTSECVPGASSACACATGAMGAQVCREDGTFGTCMCDVAPRDAGTATFDGGSMPDSGESDGGFDAGTTTDPDAGGEDAGTPIEISRVAPAPDVVYVRDTLMVQISVRSSDVDRVELLLDGMLLAELVPPYSYVWDTRTYDERSYELVATATRGATTVSTVPLTVIVDRTSPSVVRHVPLGAATNVWLHDPIEIEFSEELLRGTVTGSAVTLNAGGATGLEATVMLDPSGTTITAQLSAAPPLPATVTALVSSTITDLAGNPAVPEEWSFDAPVWTQVGGGFELSSRDPALVSGRDGRALFVAYRAFEVPWRLHVHQWTGTEWTGLGGSLSSASEKHRLVLDSLGRPLLGWFEQSGTEPMIHLARWDGTAWDRSISSVVTSYTSSFELALDGDQPVLLWVDGEVLRVARWTGTAWEQFGSGVPDIGAVRADARLGLYVRGGLPVIGFASGTFPYAGARRWDGTAWQTVGGSDFTYTSARTVVVDAGSDGRTVVGINNQPFGSSPSAVRSRVDAAGMWSSLGSEHGAYGGLLVVDDDDNPVFTRYAATTGWVVERHAGAGFTPIGTPFTTVNIADLKLYEGRLPVLATTGSAGVAVLRFNGF